MSVMSYNTAMNHNDALIIDELVEMTCQLFGY